MDSFPHTPYILMSLAGLLAVQANDIKAVRPRRLTAARAPARPRRDGHGGRPAKVLVGVEPGERT